MKVFRQGHQYNPEKRPRVLVLAWRDLDDPEAGGSERHADEVLRRWGESGLDVELRTSAVPGAPSVVHRHGYVVRRRGGRYSVFPLSILRGAFIDRWRYDAVVEIWNGAPFLTPLWAPRRLVWLHHVHGEMWSMTLSPRLAKVGWWLEHRFAPPFYRRTAIATLSQSSCREIHDRLGLTATVVRPGVDDRFVPGTTKRSTPSVLSVGRLVPVKRFDELIRAFVKVVDQVPNATLDIIGEGYMRNELELLIEQLHAESFIRLRGFLDDDALREAYQMSWLVVASSLREGWGMSLTEAAACGTPAVATDIAGHCDAVVDGVTGLLVQRVEDISASIILLLEQEEFRETLGAEARQRAAELTWEASASTLEYMLFAPK